MSNKTFFKIWMLFQRFIMLLVDIRDGFKG